MPEGWEFDDKGWTVFTQEGADRRELAPTLFGGYTGLDFAGQTIYFSRILGEDMDAPTLQIGAADGAIAVFLDNTLLYADFQIGETVIGGLRLLLLDSYRTEPVTLSLPADYLDKTLTIAQAAPAWEEMEVGEIAVYPAAVTLFCGYAYERIRIKTGEAPLARRLSAKSLRFPTRGPFCAVHIIGGCSLGGAPQ